MQRQTQLGGLGAQARFWQRLQDSPVNREKLLNLWGIGATEVSKTLGLQELAGWRAGGHKGERVGEAKHPGPCAEANNKSARLSIVSWNSGGVPGLWRLKDEGFLNADPRLAPRNDKLLRCAVKKLSRPTGPLGCPRKVNGWSPGKGVALCSWLPSIADISSSTCAFKKNLKLFWLRLTAPFSWAATPRRIVKTKRPISFRIFGLLTMFTIVTAGLLWKTLTVPPLPTVPTTQLAVTCFKLGVAGPSPMAVPPDGKALRLSTASVG